MKIACHFICPDNGPYIFNELHYIFSAILSNNKKIQAKIRLGDVLIYHTGNKDRIIRNFIQMISDVETGWTKVIGDDREWFYSSQHFTENLFGKNFFVITFEPINEDSAIFIHNSYSNLTNYVGAFEINPQSRIHRYLYTACIEEKFRIDGRNLFLLWSGCLEEDKSFHAPEDWNTVGFDSIEFENIEHEENTPQKSEATIRNSSRTPNQDHFHQLFHPFKREASLIEGIFHVGLTSLRASNLSDHGNAYAAFFNLSIGIERICKFIIIIDHMIHNDLNPPPYSEIKNYSHNLKKLFSKAGEISRNYNDRDSDININKKSIESDIINLLEDFARTTRYQNINELCNIQYGDDILTAWKGIIGRIVDEELPEKIIKKTKQQANFIHNAIKDSSIFMQFGYDRKMIDQDKFLLTAQLEERAKGRAIRHTLNIISPLCQLTWTIGRHARTKNIEQDRNKTIFPELHDFFLEIVPYPGQRVLQKRRWRR